MRNGYTTQKDILIRRRRRHILRPLLALLSAAVIVATAYILIQPGITLDTDTVCGEKEHVHNADCYQSVLDCGHDYIAETQVESSMTAAALTNGIEESEVHIHTDSCYMHTLICGLEEHTHQDSCYVSDVTLPESPAMEPTVAPAVVPAEGWTEVSAEVSTIEPTASPTEVPAAVQLSEYVYENDMISVTAVLSETAALPVDAELYITEITPETDPERYLAFQQMLELRSDDPQLAVSNGFGMLAYDIGFFVNGEEVEPSGGCVQVTIKYKSPVMDAALTEDLSLYHVVETESTTALETVDTMTPVVSDEGTVESITFEAESFSAYLITNGYTMSSSLTYKLIDQTAETFTNTSYYNASNPLGIAGNFHIVAFDTATLTTHTNGNILAKNFKANVDFGTRNYAPEITYIQNYLTVNSGSSADTSDILVVGSSDLVSLVDNGNAFAVDGIKLSKPLNIWQDNDTAALPFVNLVTVETQIKEIASMLGSQANGNLTLHLTEDMNNRYMTINNTSKVGVLNLTAAELVSLTNGFSVRGFTSGTSGSVIINVDCAGQTSVSIPKIRMYIDGILQPLSEVTMFSAGKIILNFINSAGVNLTFVETHATVIAPDANIFVTQNLNGTIIGNNVTISAESHRTDFTGTLPVTGSVKVTKAWYAGDGSALTGTAIADMSVSVQLYSNNTAMTGAAYTVTLNASNNWTYTWTGLNISSSQKYSLKEVSISKAGTVIQIGDATDDYAVAYTNNAGIETGQIDIRNTEATGSVSATKAWYASDGTALTGTGIADLAVSVQLYCNNAAMTGAQYTVTLNAANNWLYTWDSLPVSSQKYTVRETSVSRAGTVIQTGDSGNAYIAAYLNNSGIADGMITIKNTVATGSVMVTKAWYDSAGTELTGASIADLSATVQLYCNDAAMPGYTVTLNTANNWSYTWSGLDISSNQEYSVKETAIGGYAAYYDNNNGIQNGVITVTNVRGQPFVLPATGGSGAGGLYAAGIVLLLSSFLLTGMKMRYRKRKGGAP